MTSEIFEDDGYFRRRVIRAKGGYVFVTEFRPRHQEKWLFYAEKCVLKSELEAIVKMEKKHHRSKWTKRLSYP